MQNLAQVQNGRLAPPIRQDARADGAKRQEVEKLIIVYDVGFSISYTLHLAVPTRFKAFDIVSQGGADLKDFSEFNIFLNSLRAVYGEEMWKKHVNEIKIFTYCLPVKITYFKVKTFIIF